MTTLAPPWVFAAEVVDGVGDTHLVRGVHVRALPSPLVGVPATPLVVDRALVDAGQIEKSGRSQITWIDSHGAALTAPFDVAPGNPVTGYLPSADCIWIRLILATKPTSRVPVPTGLVFEALANSADGPAVLARRSAEPYILSGQRIDVVRVSGLGRVSGVRWVSRDVVDKLAWKSWQVWSLPVGPAPRYTPTANARDEAKQRVLRGAPTHQPMYVAYTAASPSTAPPAVPDDAFVRIDAIAGNLDEWLKQLLNDVSAPPSQLFATHDLGEAKGSASLPIEPHLIGSAVDPDAGHWLGFGDVDGDADLQPGTLALYRVRGLWRWDDSVASRPGDAYQRTMLAPYVRATLKQAIDGFKELSLFKIEPTLESAYLDLTALAVATIGVPPDPPLVPAIDGLDDRGWLPDPPPDVRRIVRLRASDFGPRALVALAATDAIGDRTLNPMVRLGRVPRGKPPSEPLLPLMVSRPPDATAPGQGRFEDRDAPEGSVVYRLAQGDWFGRWSKWAGATAPGKPRTAPMPPSVELLYAPPASPPVTGNASGVLTTRVPVPRITEVPAGGYPLGRLDVDVSIDGGPATTTSYPLSPRPPAPPPPPTPPPLGVTLVTATSPAHDVLQIVAVGPAIAVAAARHVSVVARWVDTGGLISPNSPPVARQLLDPRPPPLPVVPTTLQYSARPDATGHARVELAWPSTAGTRYRVFASTETVLLTALANHGLGSVAAVITAAAPGAPRAGAFRDARTHFGWDAFQCLTPEPLVATGAQMRFVHRVSGSLDGLALYRVLSEGASGVLAELTQADLIAVAVPNLGPPTPPMISLDRDPVDHENHGVALRVKVKPSRATPVAWRLRRSSMPASDPLRMNVVASGTIASGSETADGTVFTITDASPLVRWRVYRWVVEVQAGPPPGAPTTGVVPIGEWSPASAPVSLAVIPAAPPAAPASVVAVAASPGVRLTIAHPDADQLIGTAVGSYRFEVVRASLHGRPTTLSPLDVVRGAGNTFTATDLTAPPGARWSVRVIDPIGRASPATLSNEV